MVPHKAIKDENFLLPVANRAVVALIRGSELQTDSDFYIRISEFVFSVIPPIEFQI